MSATHKLVTPIVTVPAATVTASVFPAASLQADPVASAETMVVPLAATGRVATVNATIGRPATLPTVPVLDAKWISTTPFAIFA